MDSKGSCLIPKWDWLCHPVAVTRSDVQPSRGHVGKWWSCSISAPICASFQLPYVLHFSSHMCFISAPICASHLFYFSFPFCKCAKWAAPPSVMKMNMIYFLTHSWIISGANRNPVLVLTWMSFVLHVLIIWISLILYLLRCGNLHRPTLNWAHPPVVWMFCLGELKLVALLFKLN